MTSITGASPEGLNLVIEVLNEPKVQHLRVEEYPPWVVGLHRLATLGRGDIYGGVDGRLVRFDFRTPKGRTFSDKWPFLIDAEVITIIYQARRTWQK